MTDRPCPSRVVLLSVLAVLLAVAWPRAAGAQDASLLPFLAPPPPEARKALNEAEAKAGVVILSVTRDYAGAISVGGVRVGGVTTRRVRYQYLVLDPRGVERISHHLFFSEDLPKSVRIAGQTVGPGGEVFPLDPQKDVRDMDVKDAQGRKLSTARSAFFPHVVPGSVLDLSYTLTEEEFPEFEYVPLQFEFPVREQKILVQGALYKRSAGKAFLMGGAPLKVYWVPFFTGPVPPGAHARLDPEFSLDLTVRDARPLPREVAAPPRERVGYGLGLMPRIYPLKGEAELKQWRQDLTLFGPGVSARTAGEKRVIEQDIDPAAGTVRLDGLALQELPSWSTDPDLMRWWQQNLGRISERFEKFFRRDPLAAQEMVGRVLQAAPAERPWRERALALHTFVRTLVRAEPGTEDAKTLGRMLQAGVASNRDIDLLYLYFCEKLQIPARIVIPLSRYRLPLTPILESWRVFGAGYLVEVGPAGETPLYVNPGGLFSAPDTCPAAYSGALAFRQPAQEGGTWLLFRMPAAIARLDRTAAEVTAELRPDEETADFSVRVVLEGAAAESYRWDLGWDRYSVEQDPAAKKMKEASAELVRNYTGLEWPGALPTADHRTDLAKPLVVEAKVEGRSEVQVAGDQLLALAVLPAFFCRGFLTDETREMPLWLPGGRYEMALTWRLPPGYAPLSLPPAQDREGPGGLRFHMESQSSSPEGSPGTVTTRLTADLPDMLPASDYAGAKAFFEALQRAVETRLVLAPPPAGGAAP